MTPQEIVNKINNPAETPFKVYYTINEFLDNDKENDVIVYLQNYFKCTEDTAMETMTLYKETIYTGHKEVVEKNIASLTPEQRAHNQAVAREALNKPKCPICSSTNIQKISITKRAVKTAFFGALGAIDDASKTYQCKNCGSKF